MWAGTEHFLALHGLQQLLRPLASGERQPQPLLRDRLLGLEGSHEIVLAACSMSGQRLFS